MPAWMNSELLKNVERYNEGQVDHLMPLQYLQNKMIHMQKATEDPQTNDTFICVALNEVLLISKVRMKPIQPTYPRTTIALRQNRENL